MRTRILFVCHGNICRSPMAEFVFQDMVKKKGLENEFFVASAATSREEIGNPVHRGTREKLKACGVPMYQHYATQLTKKDYDEYDYLIGMDNHNIRNMQCILGEDKKQKVYRLLDFSNSPRDIADPWYTGNFDITYSDVVEGCQNLLDYILKRNNQK